MRVNIDRKYLKNQLRHENVIDWNFNFYDIVRDAPECPKRWGVVRWLKVCKRAMPLVSLKKGRNENVNTSSQTKPMIVKIQFSNHFSSIARFLYIEVLVV